MSDFVGNRVDWGSELAIKAGEPRSDRRSRQDFAFKLMEWRRFGARRVCIVNAGTVQGRSMLANRGEVDRVGGKDRAADMLGEDVTKDDGKGVEVGDDV
jgi:hypothetical protein